MNWDCRRTRQKKAFLLLNKNHKNHAKEGKLATASEDTILFFRFYFFSIVFLLGFFFLVLRNAEKVQRETANSGER